MSFLKHILSRIFEGFDSAVAHVGGLSATGIVLGFGLLWLKERLGLTPDTTAGVLVEHLGMGFIVSAIAVFGYEWKGHSKANRELSHRLLDALAAQGEASLDHGLAQLIDQRKLPEGARDVAKHCKTVIMSISKLLQAGDRVTDHYVNFVSGLLRAVVKRNAEALVDLHQREDEVTFRVPANAAVLADDILAEQMKAMNRGDSYDVVSDLSSWDDKLQDFFYATRDAVHNGVTVRRIFNLFHIGRDPLTITKTMKVLEQHLSATKEWQDSRRWGKGKYQVKVFSSIERNDSKATSVRAITEANLREMHFGIFNLKSQHGKVQRVRFRVTEPDLSELLISRNPEEIRSDINSFELLWRYSADLTKETIDKVAATLGANPKVANRS
ncbi:MAG: hypothetical protein ABUT39_22815 [Acidobacteriota bacterium]